MTPLRRVGVLGDVHTEDVALDAALRFFADRSLDAVLCVGDVIDGLGDADRTCSLLIEHGVITVRGNHERWFLAGGTVPLADGTPARALSERAREFLAGLPATRAFATEAGLMMLCHGIGRDDMACLFPDDQGYGLSSNTPLWKLHAEGDTAVMIGGHTHHRMVRRFDHLTVLNAGTLARAHQPCVMVVDFAAGEVEFHDVGAGGITLAQRVPLTKRL